MLNSEKVTGSNSGRGDLLLYLQNNLLLVILMKFIDELNKRHKNTDIYDLSLTKGAVFFATLFLVKFWPVLSSMDWYVYVVIAIILAIRPAYHMLKK